MPAPSAAVPKFDPDAPSVDGTPGVRVSIALMPPEGAAEAASYARRALRKIDDVTVTDDRPDFRIDLVVRPLAAGGYHIVAVTESFVYETVSEQVLAAKHGGYVRTITDRFCQTAELETALKSIIGQADGEVFETLRKTKAAAGVPSKSGS